DRVDLLRGVPRADRGRCGRARASRQSPNNLDAEVQGSPRRGAGKTRKVPLSLIRAATPLRVGGAARGVDDPLLGAAFSTKAWGPPGRAAAAVEAPRTPRSSTLFRPRHPPGTRRAFEISRGGRGGTDDEVSGTISAPCRARGGTLARHAA